MKSEKRRELMERTIYVYLPDVKKKEQWQKLAKNRGLSVSKWVINCIDELLLERDNKTRSREEVEKELFTLREEIKSLREKINQLSILKDRYEEELRRYRNKDFLDTDFEDKRKFNKDLVDLLRRSKGHDNIPKPVPDTEIFSLLGLDFNDIESIKAISKQLEILESYGIIKSTPKGWRWID